MFFFLPLALFCLAVFFLVCVVCFPVFCLLCSACFTGCLRGLATVAVCCPGLTQPTFPIYLLFPFCLRLLLVLLSSVFVPVVALRLLVFCFFFLLAVPCAFVVGGCSCGVVMLCLRCPCLLSLLNASSPKGASERCFRSCNACCSPSSGLSSCILSGYGCRTHARSPMCHACTCLLVLRLRGLGPVLIYWLVCSALAQTTWLDSLCFSLASLFLPMAPKVRAGERRAAERADREASDRRVRQRLDDFETRLDGAESLGRNHDQRISFQESPQRIVLRGFCLRWGIHAG